MDRCSREAYRSGEQTRISILPSTFSYLAVCRLNNAERYWPICSTVPSLHIPGGESIPELSHNHLIHMAALQTHKWSRERGGSVVECWTREREVEGSIPTAAVLCPWARHFTPRKYWLITQEAVASSRHDWKIVDWDIKPQHKQTNKQMV